jgi:hypothetical protein
LSKSCQKVVKKLSKSCQKVAKSSQKVVKKFKIQQTVVGDGEIVVQRPSASAVLTGRRQKPDNCKSKIDPARKKEKRNML